MHIELLYHLASCKLHGGCDSRTSRQACLLIALATFVWKQKRDSIPSKLVYAGELETLTSE